jgi:hypothetical protein
MNSVWTFIEKMEACFHANPLKILHSHPTG